MVVDPDGFAGFLKSDRYHRSNRRRHSVRESHGRGTAVAGINRRTGRWEVSPIN